ncbi:MAG: P13 family porin [Spirochaetia bacterium]|nr:P13 family porin [Spirochaetia bacterium]
MMRLKKKILKIIIVCHPLFISFQIFSIENKEASIPKVLILDFVDISNSPDHQYLKTTIPESFSASLSRFNKFQILDRNIWHQEVSRGNFLDKNAFDQKTALKIAKKYNVDIVVIGGFAASKDQVQVFTKAIETSSEKNIVNDKGEFLNVNIFSSISKFTDKMAFEVSSVKISQMMNDVHSDQAESDVRSLIAAGLMENRTTIYKKSAFLSDDERGFIYNHYSKEATTAFALNWFIGFGLGSFLQGDNSGGQVALWGELGSVGLFIAGIAAIHGDTGVAIGSTGMLAFLGFKLFEMFRPWSFAEVYNKKLGESLRVSVIFVPYINLAQNGDSVYGVGVTARF